MSSHSVTYLIKNHKREEEIQLKANLIAISRAERKLYLNNLARQGELLPAAYLNDTRPLQH